MDRCRGKTNTGERCPRTRATCTLHRNANGLKPLVKPPPLPSLEQTFVEKPSTAGRPPVPVPKPIEAPKPVAVPVPIEVSRPAAAQKPVAPCRGTTRKGTSCSNMAHSCPHHREANGSSVLTAPTNRPLVVQPREIEPLRAQAKPKPKHTNPRHVRRPPIPANPPLGVVFNYHTVGKNAATQRNSGVLYGRYSVANVFGSSSDSHPSGYDGWAQFYTETTQQAWPALCCIEGCQRVAHVGGHMYAHAMSTAWNYILPICSSHNNTRSLDCLRGRQATDLTPFTNWVGTRGDVFLAAIEEKDSVTQFQAGVGMRTTRRAAHIIMPVA